MKIEYRRLSLGYHLIVLFILLLQSNFAQENNELFQVLSETVTDYDGNVYKTVIIGEQIWMLENLKVTHYRNGTPIRNIYDNNKWSNAIDGAYCMVGNDSVEYKKIFGVLYNYYAVVNENKLSPKGWHIPTEQECMILFNYLGGVDVAGEKIKDNSLKLWKVKNPNATNESGYSGLPAGGRGRLGFAGEVGYYATWWSSTSYDSLYAWHWGLYPEKKAIRYNAGHKASGFSIRCIRD